MKTALPGTPAITTLLLMKHQLDFEKPIAELQNKLGLAIGGRAYKAYTELLASPRMQKLMND